MNSDVNDWHTRLEGIATPSLVVDEAIVRNNIDRLATYAASHGLNVRPHTKTHKSGWVADRQIYAGAIGLTVAKVGEADVMQSHSRQLLVAYPIVDEARALAVSQLGRNNEVMVTIDSKPSVELLSRHAQEQVAEFDVLIDLDVGYHRTGVQSINESVELAQLVTQFPGLNLMGLFYYPGHVGGPSEQQKQSLKQIEDTLAEAITQWKIAGLNCDTVSGGSTPTAFQSHLIPSTTEIRPGTYVFNDVNSIRFGVAELSDCAARIVATVVSTAVDGQVVIDAGSKTLTSDLCGPAPESGHGLIVEYPEAVIKKLTEEHGQVDVTQCEQRPQLGERISIIPNHICPCINLQDTLVLKEGDGISTIFVDGRGRLV